jgi:hypothetical protein
MAVFVFILLISFTISNQITEIKLIAIHVKSCSKFNVSNSKKLVRGFTKRMRPTIAMVIKTINKTRLFLYFKVVNME